MGMRKITIGMIAVMAIVGAVVIAFNLAGSWEVLARTNIFFIVAAVFFTFISYYSQAWGFWSACRMFKINIPTRELLEIGFASDVLTNVLAAGGIPGHSYRLMTMKRPGVPVADITAASIVHAYFNNIVFIAFLPFALIYLAVFHLFTPAAEASLVIAAALSLAAFAFATAAVFSKRVRDLVFRGIAWLAGALRYKTDIRSFLKNLGVAFDTGIANTRRNKLMLTLAAAVAFDWLGMVAALGACLAAFGPAVDPGKLFVGFAVGIAAGAASFIPAGLGVQDGSMAGTFALLGIGLGQSVIALILFRIVFYFFAFVASFLFFGKAIVRLRQ